MDSNHNLMGFEWTPNVPKSYSEAVKALLPWVDARESQLAEAPVKDLLTAWNALVFLYPGLNPDDGVDREPEFTYFTPPEGMPDHSARSYDRSGWPVSLVALLDEMWRRYESGDISEAEFYCVGSVWAGVMAGRSVLAR